jgi:dephospho-CoA kinase
MSHAVCISGGIGSGKTTVCKYLESLGYPVYYSDARAKELMLNDAEIRTQIISIFGSEAYEGNRLNRGLLANLIFKKEELKLKLEKIVHPRVREDFKQWLRVHDEPLVFKESPIAIEIHDKSCMDIWLVTAPEHLRLTRILHRNPNWTREDVIQRMKNQLGDHERNHIGVECLDNSTSLESLLIQVDEALAKWT